MVRPHVLLLRALEGEDAVLPAGEVGRGSLSLSPCATGPGCGCVGCGRAADPACAVGKVWHGQVRLWHGSLSPGRGDRGCHSAGAEREPENAALLQEKQLWECGIPRITLFLVYQAIINVSQSAAGATTQQWVLSLGRRKPAAESPGGKVRAMESVEKLLGGPCWEWSWEEGGG